MQFKNDISHSFCSLDSYLCNLVLAELEKYRYIVLVNSLRRKYFRKLFDLYGLQYAFAPIFGVNLCLWESLNEWFPLLHPQYFDKFREIHYDPFSYLFDIFHESKKYIE